MQRNTVQEMVAQSEKHLSQARQSKEAMKLANRSIHNFGGEDSVWAAIGAGATVRGLCRTLGINPMTLYRWVERGGELRREKFEQARRQQAQTLMDEMLDIADQSSPGTVQADKLRIDVRKWQASKLDPALWGQPNQAAVHIDLGKRALEALRQRTSSDQSAGSG
jgi:transposase-like protein